MNKVGELHTAYDIDVEDEDESKDRDLAQPGPVYKVTWQFSCVLPD
jgi:hypothetical protein